MCTSILTRLSSICSVVTLQTQESWRRGHHGAIRDITFAVHVIKGASSGIIRQLGHFQKDVCVDAFNAFQCHAVLTKAFTDGAQRIIESPDQE